MKLAEADDLEPQRIDARLGELMHDARRARRGQLPVRRKRRRADRAIVGMALDADRIREGLEHLGELVEHGRRRGREFAGAAREQDVGVDLDLEPHVLAPHRDQLRIDQRLHGVLHLALHADQRAREIAPEGVRSGIGDREA